MSAVMLKYESTDMRAIVEGSAVYIHEKGSNRFLQYVLEDDRQEVLKGHDWQKPKTMRHDAFEAFWQKADNLGETPVKKVISGGQTGADRGGLDAAIALNDHRQSAGGKIYDLGGWCPYGRKSEDGKIPDEYAFLEETKSRSYVVRTRRNIDEADATLIFVDGGMSGGSLVTVEHCKKRRKLHLVVELVTYRIDPITLDRTEIELDGLTWLLRAGRVRNWLTAGKVKVLNVAGSRESKVPGIQNRVGRFMVDVLR